MCPKRFSCFLSVRQRQIILVHMICNIHTCYFNPSRANSFTNIDMYMYHQLLKVFSDNTPIKTLLSLIICIPISALTKNFIYISWTNFRFQDQKTTLLDTFNFDPCKPSLALKGLRAHNYIISIKVGFQHRGQNSSFQHCPTSINLQLFRCNIQVYHCF